MKQKDGIIRLEDVQKSFSDKKVLNGVDLCVHKGETLVILGRSGCGKSVTLKILLGLLRVDSGIVVIDGQDISRMSEKNLFEVRRMFGMLFQGSALFDSLTVGENVAYALTEFSHKI